MAIYLSLARLPLRRRRHKNVQHIQSQPVGVAAAVVVGDDDGSGSREIVVAFSAAIITRRFGTRHSHTHTHVPNIPHQAKRPSRTECRNPRQSDSFFCTHSALISFLFLFFLVSRCCCCWLVLFVFVVAAVVVVVVLCDLPFAVYRLCCANAFTHTQTHTQHSPAHCIYFASSAPTWIPKAENNTNIKSLTMQRAEQREIGSGARVKRRTTKTASLPPPPNRRMKCRKRRRS